MRKEGGREGQGMEGSKADPRITKTERKMKTLMRMGVNPCSYRSQALPADVQTFTARQWGGYGS